MLGKEEPGRLKRFGRRLKSVISAGEDGKNTQQLSQVSFVGPAPGPMPPRPHNSPSQPDTAPGEIHLGQLPIVQFAPAQTWDPIATLVHPTTSSSLVTTTTATTVGSIINPPPLNSSQLTYPPSKEGDLPTPNHPDLLQESGSLPGLIGPTSHDSAPFGKVKKDSKADGSATFTPGSADQEHGSCTTVETYTTPALVQTKLITSNSQGILKIKPASNALQTVDIAPKNALEDKFASVWEATLQIANPELTKNKLAPLDPQNFAVASAEENIRSVITQLEAAQSDNQKQRWHYTRRGQTVTVVERWGKILRMIEKYSKIVDAGIQHSPEVSSLVWASAKMILQVALNHAEAIECLEATMATVVNTIARCEFYARIYMGSQLRTNNSNLQKMLDLALPGLYAAVVVFAIKAKEYFCARWPKNIANMLKPFDVEIKPFIDEITAKEKVIQESANSVTMARIKEMEGVLQDISSGVELLNDIAESVNENHKETVALRNTIQDEKINKLLKGLSPLEPLKRHQDIKSIRLPDTGTWLLQRASFHSWINTEGHENSRLLCCYGIPGAGKTFITSLVVDDLNSRFVNSSGIGIACLYSDYRDQTKQNLVYILGTILYQLLNTNLVEVPPEIIKTLEDIERKRSKIGADVVLDMLKLTLPQFKCAFICIDALDELEFKTRLQFFAILQKLSVYNIRLFLTGRKHVQSEVQSHLQLHQQYEVDISADRQDIEKYLNEEIDADPDPEAMDETLKQDILNKIVSQSNGMFLLPVLHIKMILAKPTRTERRRALNTLPKDLYLTFQEIIKRIQDTERYAKLGMKIFMWLHFAYRPLGVEELRHALSVQQGDTNFDPGCVPSLKALITSCCGLVIIDEETSTVRFVHYTLEEYFQELSSELFPNGDSTAAEICLTYLNFDQVTPHCTTTDEIKARIKEFPFLEYAAVNWGKHYWRQSNDTVKECALKLLEATHEGVHSSCGLQVLYSSLLDISYVYRSYQSEVASLFVGIHAAAYFGLVDIVKCLSLTKEVCLRDDGDMTPLSWAAAKGHEAVVEVLLASNGIDVNALDVHRRSPLSFAVQNGHEAVLRLLLANDDVDVNVKDNHCWTPLSQAVRNGHEAVVKLLLARNDVNVNSKGRFESTPLSWAARQGHGEIVRLLLARDYVDVNAKDESRSTPLSWAARQGHRAIVRLLLSRNDVDVNAKDRSENTPLLWAAGQGHEAIVQMLLARNDIDVNPKDGSKNTPLLWAAGQGYETIVRALLARKDVDVNAKNGSENTPLLWAAREGHEAIVRALLASNEVDVNAKGGFESTPLSWAAKQGHEAIVGLLLARNDIDVNAKDRSKNTPLLCAAGQGHEAIVRVLLARKDVDVNAKDRSGNTPLLWAARFGREAIVRLLLASDDVDVNAKDCSYYRTPLSWAAAYGYEAVIRLLLARDDIDPNEKDNENHTALTLATQGKHMAIVDLLCSVAESHPLSLTFDN